MIIVLMLAAISGGAATAAAWWPQIGPLAVLLAPFGGSAAAFVTAGLLSMGRE